MNDVANSPYHEPGADSDQGGAESPQKLLDSLLTACVQRGASDLHLASNQPPYFRVHGVLKPEPVASSHSISLNSTNSMSSTFSSDWVEGLIGELTLRAGCAPLGKSGSVDGALTHAQARFRFNAYRERGAPSIAIRRLEDRFRTLDELGLRNTLYRLCSLTDGLVIVAGPTGAGKSTTLAALLDRINQSRSCHIVTIEDPIEYLHENAMSLVSQRQIGTDASTFYEALVASLRQDPDVILVGEIRDLATIRTAISAAETGHLVFTTVHAGDCVGAIERLISVFPAEEQLGVRKQLALTLRCIIAQHLLIADGSAPAATRQSEGVGRRTRVVASEILKCNSAIANLIANGKSAQIYSALETGAVEGMHTLDEDLARLWGKGMISEATARALCRNPDVLRDRMHSRRDNDPIGARRESFQ